MTYRVRCVRVRFIPLESDFVNFTTFTFDSGSQFVTIQTHMDNIMTSAFDFQVQILGSGGAEAQVIQPENPVLVNILCNLEKEIVKDMQTAPDIPDKGGRS